MASWLPRLVDFCMRKSFNLFQEKVSMVQFTLIQSLRLESMYFPICTCHSFCAVEFNSIHFGGGKKCIHVCSQVCIFLHTNLHLLCLQMFEKGAPYLDVNPLCSVKLEVTHPGRIWHMLVLQILLLLGLIHTPHPIAALPCPVPNLPLPLHWTHLLGQALLQVPVPARRLQPSHWCGRLLPCRKALSD